MKSTILMETTTFGDHDSYLAIAVGTGDETRHTETWLSVVKSREESGQKIIPNFG
jgi:hypothetical protein